MNVLFLLCPAYRAGARIQMQLLGSEIQFGKVESPLSTSRDRGGLRGLCLPLVSTEAAHALLCLAPEPCWSLELLLAHPERKPGEIFLSMGCLFNCHLPSLGLPPTMAVLESELDVKSSLVLTVLSWDTAAAPWAWCHPCCHTPCPSCHRNCTF